MRLTHTTALRGFAVLSAGAALFASTMLAGAGAANAAAVTAPAQAAQTIGQTPTYGGESHCWWHKDGKKDHDKKDHGKKEDGKEDGWAKEEHSKADSEKHWDGMKDEMWSKKEDKDGKKDHDKKEDGKKDDGWAKKEDGKKDDGWGKEDGKKEHDGGKADSEKHWGDMKDEHSKKDGKKDGCHMPRGSVESGRGGAALADSQSPATSISLGALSALMLGSGVWTLARTRRTRVSAK